MADVVEVQLTGFPGSGGADHWAFTVAAEQLACKQIIAVDAVPALWILFRFQHLLHAPKQSLVYDLRDATFNADVPVYVYAGIALVCEQPVKAAASPFSALTGLYAPGVEVSANVNKTLSASYTAVYLPDHIVIWGVELIAHIFAFLVAERKRTGDFAVDSIIVQPSFDVLRHVLAVELVYVHHGTESEATGSSVVEVLLRVKDPDSHVI